MFPTISAAIEKDIGPFLDALNIYGALNQLASRLIFRSYIDPSSPSPITAVAEAIWNRLQIVNGPLGSNKTGPTRHRSGLRLFP
ncbi:hypothetical protein J3R83DRAFT_1358 [Lanmaoa asiatica]|nr:hypothetical protein J3R83DRAFT_1358 [Lanmaoa asiatica]